VNLRAAVDSMCRQCIYSPGEGSWRQQVGACTARHCSLYSVRPLPDLRVGADRRVAVEKTAKLARRQTVARVSEERRP
jgi:hypothetical protein